MAKCPNCGRDSSDSAIFCSSCGGLLSTKCPICGAEMERGHLTVNTYGYGRHGCWHPGDEPPGIWDLRAEVIVPNTSSYVIVGGYVCRNCRTLLLRY